MRVIVTALIFTLAVGLVLPTTQPVKAENGIWNIFRNKERRERRQDLRQQRQVEIQRRQAASTPTVKVSSPRYYNYKPDAMKAMDLSVLANSNPAELHPMHRPPSVDPMQESRQNLDGYRVTVFPEVGEAIVNYYKNNSGLIWVSGDQANDRAREALETMARADEVGLDPAMYQLDPPDSDYDASDMEARQRELIRFEMDMSAKALTYILDATRGLVDPNRLSGYHDLERNTVDFEPVMLKLSVSDDIESDLLNSNPRNDKFLALQQELARLQEIDEKEHVEIAEGTFLKPGTSNPELANVIKAIQLRGSDTLLMNHSLTFVEFEKSDSDVYTPELVNLVKDFQKENGLSADGIVGRNTIARMEGVTNADKIEMVKLAMERLRWLPKELGPRRVFVNQAAFMADYVENDKVALSMRVVVGTRANQTNFFRDEIETVEYNPYWGVPGSIIVNEMLPRLRGNPHYLDSLGYEVTDRRGRRISSASVNWYSVGANSIPVDVRQPPGPKNALGELKILFPNSHAIYMHDTPSKSLFEKDKRAYSHGCIRLQDPRAMAAAVLGKSRDHVAAQISQGRNLSEEVPVKMPVYISYFTAWPDDSGKVGYFADTYDRDKYLGQAVEKTGKSRAANG
ncbi:L,D-transpeptidase family protein [Hoeflea sp. CAU 1731]